MKQAIIYARFSPRPNASECDSCEFQERKAREYCAYRDMDILAVYKDKGASGKNTDRQGFERALVHVCKERAVLVCYNMARLSRSIKDLVHIADVLNKSKANLAFVTEQIDTSTPGGRLMFHNLAAIGQFIRESTAEHTRAVMLDMQARGHKISNECPFGFRPDVVDPKMLAPVHEEQQAIKVIMHMHSYSKSVAKIIRELERRGCKPRGKKWYHQTVKRIIQLNK